MKGKLENTFNKEAIKKMSFKEFEETQKKACAFHKISCEDAYFLLTGKKPEKKAEKVIKKPEKKAEK